MRIPCCRKLEPDSVSVDAFLRVRATDATPRLVNYTCHQPIRESVIRSVLGPGVRNVRDPPPPVKSTLLFLLQRAAHEPSKHAYARADDVACGNGDMA